MDRQKISVWQRNAGTLIERRQEWDNAECGRFSLWIGSSSSQFEKMLKNVRTIGWEDCLDERKKTEQT